jgi:hypothetical protein
VQANNKNFCTAKTAKSAKFLKVFLGGLSVLSGKTLSACPS